MVKSKVVYIIFIAKGRKRFECKIYSSARHRRLKGSENVGIISL